MQADWEILLRKWRFEDVLLTEAFEQFANTGVWPPDAASRAADFTGMNVGAEALRLRLLERYGPAPLSDQKLGIRFRVLRLYQFWISGLSPVETGAVQALLDVLRSINTRVADLERMNSP